MMKGTIMGKYHMQGRSLFNSHNRRVAMTNGRSIYDADNRRIGLIEGDELLDGDGRIMMIVRGGGIYDGGNERVAGLSEMQDSIEGIAEGMVRTSLWYCFVR
jgi:hypothetical protein